MLSYDNHYQKKGENVNIFCIGGAKDRYFRAESVEMFGLKFN